MMLHGSGSPKRTIILSPMPTISQLDLGRLSKADKAKRTKITTVRAMPEHQKPYSYLLLTPRIKPGTLLSPDRHLGKDGKMKFTCRKSELKQSGHLASHSWVFGRMGGRRDPERERDAGLERESD